MPDNNANVNAITVDFENPTSQPYQIVEKKLQFTKRTFLKLFPRAVDGKFHELSVDVVDLPDDIQLNNKQDLVLIKTHGKRASRLNDIPITSHEMPFEILLDTSQIIDYNNLKSDSELIKIEYAWRETAQAAAQKEHVQVPLLFKRAFSKPVLEFDLRPEFHTGFTHRRQRVPLGLLRVGNHSNFRYSHDLDCNDLRALWGWVWTKLH